MTPNDRARFCSSWEAAHSVYGKVPPPEATGLCFMALSVYSIEQIEAALFKHINNPANGQFAPKPADVVKIIGVDDTGHPGPEQAWGMIPKDEDTSAVVTQEMLKAWGIAQPIYDEGDKVGARMAFKEVYEREVAKGLPPRWIASMGHDPAGRIPVLMDAMAVGKLTMERAMMHAGKAAEALMVEMSKSGRALTHEPQN